MDYLKDIFAGQRIMQNYHLNKKKILKIFFEHHMFYKKYKIILSFFNKDLVNTFWMEFI